MNTEPKRLWVNHWGWRILQHIFFWSLSFFIFLFYFKIGVKPVEIDYLYTLLFHLTIIPSVYIHFFFLLPQINKPFVRWWSYVGLTVLLIFTFSMINYSFFSNWSNIVLPDYFFISYFNLWQVLLFFISYLSITSLLKFSKSWFTVNELKKELLIAEKENAELELKALRAQMNPHFIFNCMNSIKSLVQEKEDDKAITYLTSFSKLLRTIFTNADKKEISLFDEIETCKCYLQLEAMRFDAAFNYTINTDPEIDLKSVNIPALIIQPFIENAIWHGIVPGGGGGNIRLDVETNNGYVEIIVEDDGIGREVSQKNKAATKLTHDSKGVNLTQSRLELDNLLRQRHAKMEIIDKRDAMGNSLGTKVIIRIEEDKE